MSRRKWTLSIFLLTFVVWFAYPFLEPYETWQSIGPVQVLGGPDEVWVFAERSITVRLPGRLVEAPVRTAGHDQEVVVFDGAGEKLRIKIPGTGPTFHPNLGRILRRADDFYLVHEESLNYYASVFRWSKDHFDLLPLPESEKWLKETGLAEARSEEVHDRFDRITKESGWKHLYHSQSLYNTEPFTWGLLQLKFDFEEGPPLTLYRILSVEQGRRLMVTVLSFDPARRQIGRGEYAAISQFREPGHRKTP